MDLGPLFLCVWGSGGGRVVGMVSLDPHRKKGIGSV
jgi:hypothetical protein